MEHIVLSREYILSLEAGRELDALVAEKVMGWEKRYLPMSDFVKVQLERIVAIGDSEVSPC